MTLRAKICRLIVGCLSILLFIGVLVYVGGRAGFGSTVAVSNETGAYEDVLRAHFLDVGQGDSIFLELPGGSTMLVDTGDVGRGEAIVAYIQALGYTKLDYLVLTHPHADHIGGAAAVLTSLDVSEIWMPEVSNDTAVFENLLDTIAGLDLPVYAAEAGIDIYEAHGCSVDIISPAQGAVYDDLNDYSVVLLVRYGDTSILLSGDCSYQVLEEIGCEHVDILKVSHHGSYTGTGYTLKEQLTPDFCVIEVGADNDYGHPSSSTLFILSASTILRTDLDGTIVFESNGSEVELISTSETRLTDEFEEPESSGQTTSSEGQSGTDTVTVYITETGTKYHAAGCKYLSKSKIAISLELALAQGYTACKVCMP